MDVIRGTDVEVADLWRTGHFLHESGHHGDTWLKLDRLFVDGAVSSVSRPSSRTGFGDTPSMSSADRSSGAPVSASGSRTA